MNRKLLFTLVLITSLAGTLRAQRISFEEYNMPNGMHVILHQDNTTPIVAVTITYHVGSKNENPNRTGFAHFMEHLMFEGSENIGRGEFFKIAQNAGGQINAYTSHDKTFYYELLPSNQLELGLWMESERLLHLVIDSIGVETQRSVVKEERSARYDNQPYGSVIEEIFVRAYTNHPYKWLPIGSAQYIDQATLQEFQEFHSTYYVPQNATLCIAGDIDVAKTKELINKYFADIPRGRNTIERPNIVEPPLGREIRDTIFDNIQLPAVIQAYRIPANGTDDAYALSMLTNIMSQGESSRMYKSIVDQQQKAVAVFSFPFPLEDPGLFLVFGIANMGVSAVELEQAINVEIEKVLTEGLTDREFQKAQNMVEADFINGLSSVATIADKLADYHTFFNDANLINTEIEKYRRVTPQDIQRVARTYLVENNRVVLHYLPKQQ
ncbi:MAG: pitrilysin family protein [Bacteroidales bacterium]|nr:pitrilysin family protein [Bacteroidales bacterium]